MGPCWDHILCLPSTCKIHQTRRHIFPIFYCSNFGEPMLTVTPNSWFLLTEVEPADVVAYELQGPTCLYLLRYLFAYHSLFYDFYYYYYYYYNLSVNLNPFGQSPLTSLIKAFPPTEIYVNFRGFFVTRHLQFLKYLAWFIPLTIPYSVTEIPFLPQFRYLIWILTKAVDLCLHDLCIALLPHDWMVFLGC